MPNPIRRSPGRHALKKRLPIGPMDRCWVNVKLSGMSASKLQERVVVAAQRVLKQNGAVGPIDLLVYLRLIQPVHFDAWKRGNPHYKALEDHIQCGEVKLKKIYRIFSDWAKSSGFEPLLTEYHGASRGGPRKLQLLADEDTEYETFLLTRYQRADLTDARKKQIKKKLTKAPDLVVFILTGKPATCSECDQSIEKGELMYREEDLPLCMQCADFDYLEFLPSGNATLTRRAKKFSNLSAVVVKFNRRRKRFERQGLLVDSSAIREAESSMDADSDQRRKQRDAAEIRRVEDDKKLVQAMVDEIKQQFPSCPADDATRIAEHTALRGSGRVGRSAAGRDVEPKAIKLAVIAHIRHLHTPYDELLMDGVPRREARTQIQSAVQNKLSEWQAT